MILSLDQGTHGSRALLFNPAGRLIAESNCDINLTVLDELCVEQDAEEILASMRYVIGEIANLGPVPCHAGLACQRSSLVCWDRVSGKALSPVLSWQDRRAVEQLKKLQSKQSRIKALTGLPLSPHYSASKIAWCLQHVPAVQNAMQAGTLVCSPLSSFVSHHLCLQKQVFVDHSNAARTLLWSIQEKTWHQELLTLFNIPRHILPECVASAYDYGQLQQIPSCTLKLVMGDQGAALFANGWPRENHIYINLGTGCFVSTPTPPDEIQSKDLLKNMLFSGNEDVFCLEGTVNGGNAAIEWFRQEFGDFPIPNKGWDHEVYFMNGVGGLGSPHWQNIQSRFIGQGEHEDKFLALLESIVFLIQDNVKAIKSHKKSQKQQSFDLLISGGLANHALFCQMLADLNKCSVKCNLETEATAKGLAYLLTSVAERQNWQNRWQSYEPQTNPGLIQRYGNWRAHLIEAIKKKT